LITANIEFRKTWNSNLRQNSTFCCAAVSNWNFCRNLQYCQSSCFCVLTVSVH